MVRADDYEAVTFGSGPCSMQVRLVARVEDYRSERRSYWYHRHCPRFGQTPR